MFLNLLNRLFSIRFKCLEFIFDLYFNLPKSLDTQGDDNKSKEGKNDGDELHPPPQVFSASIKMFCSHRIEKPLQFDRGGRGILARGDRLPCLLCLQQWYHESRGLYHNHRDDNPVPGFRGSLQESLLFGGFYLMRLTIYHTPPYPVHLTQRDITLNRCFYIPHKPDIRGSSPCGAGASSIPGFH